MSLPFSKLVCLAGVLRMKSRLFYLAPKAPHNPTWSVSLFVWPPLPWPCPLTPLWCCHLWPFLQPNCGLILPVDFCSHSLETLISWLHSSAPELHNLLRDLPRLTLSRVVCVHPFNPFTMVGSLIALNIQLVLVLSVCSTSPFPRAWAPSAVGHCLSYAAVLRYMPDT